MAALRVISASRRVDMIGGYPDRLAQTLRERCPPESVHTLVLWTKDASNLFAHTDLRTTVEKYRHVYIHYTITGMGGTFLEPRIPPIEAVANTLPDVMRLVGDPQRIRIRFDPVVHLILPNGQRYTNLGEFEKVARIASDHGIFTMSTSWMAAYRKVVRRLSKKGITAVQPSESERLAQLTELRRIAEVYHITLHGCCVPEMPMSRCIDGELLVRLHPEHLPCSTVRARDQRETCGCTESFDVGWYLPCPHGCLYCYANPLED